MADVRPTKLQNDGNGYGSLREFSDGDTVPVALGGTGAATAAGARLSLFDARLQNFSLLLGGADQLPFQTGPNTWAQTPLTSVGRGMLGASTQANALSYIGGVPKSLSSNRAVSDPNTVADECGFYGIGSSPWSNLPPGIDTLNPIGSMLYHHPYDASTAVQLFVPRTSNILYFRRKTAGTWQPWVRVLSDAQLLGTVAQSGGTPIGSVLERGSNANGEYIRIADGTQLCWFNASVTDQAVDTSYGSLFTGTRGWSFPATFVGSPTVSVGLFRWGTGAGWGTVGGVASTTSVTLRIFDISSRATGTATAISAIATGRWF